MNKHVIKFLIFAVIFTLAKMVSDTAMSGYFAAVVVTIIEDYIGVKNEIV